MNREDELPGCFGDLDTVFPMQENGLRKTPDDCYYHCPVKTRCLTQALATRNGAAVEEEMLERSEKAGLIGFFERWSRKKQLHRRVSAQGKEEA